MNAPVLLLIFNRPDTTALVFEKIKQYKPEKLYVAADGARNDRPSEIEKCERAKNVVLDSIDWDCGVKTLFREENLGCGKAVSQAINWFFANEEFGIILEDDCLPNDSFFSFCNDLLIKYLWENRIMMISGCSFQKEQYDDNSYYFSNYIHVWGWATWRRAWQQYEFRPPNYDTIGVNRAVRKKFKKEREREIWNRNIFNAVNGAIDTWDYQWMYAIWKNDGYSIVSWKNLISNIGYGEDATHTKGFDDKTMVLPTYQLNIAKHPSKIVANRRADKHIRYKLIINKITLVSLLKKAVRKLINYKKRND